MSLEFLSLYKYFVFTYASEIKLVLIIIDIRADR